MSCPSFSIDDSLSLLGGLSASAFMQKYWQKKPFCISNALDVDEVNWPSVQELMQLSFRDDVESRLVTYFEKKWQLQHGPLSPRLLPSFKKTNWTFLVQGVNLYHEGVDALMRRFNFIPHARLDDVMISVASDQGGVGPHFDSYDVFLIQVSGYRRWRIGKPQKNRSFIAELPLKILSRFEYEHEWVLGPGDILYLPPGWAHEGVAIGNDCMTASIGFKVPQRSEMAREIMMRVADGYEDETLYKDPKQGATQEPAAIPETLFAFAQAAIHKMNSDASSFMMALGEYLTEPKAHVCFEPRPIVKNASCWQLDQKTNMQYRESWLFVNGEAFKVGGKDKKILQRLANYRYLAVADYRQLSLGAQKVLKAWAELGWVHVVKGQQR